MPTHEPVLIWCEPAMRGDLKLAPGDIADSLAWFKEKTGKDARLIVLNPKNERYASEARDSVKVEYQGGCLAWEVWLSVADNCSTDIERDTVIVNDGGFVCKACLMGKPVIEQSPDDRYCQDCYQFLLKEAEVDTARRGGDWKPIRPTSKPDDKGETVHKDTAQVSGDVRRNMSTVTDKKSEVDIIRPPHGTGATTKGKRGPKHRPLPDNLIMQWAGEGIGSKMIAARLRSELDITVSYKTIQRILSGQRVLVDI